MSNAVNILSLCDGMSCARIAMRQAGIPVEKYYASEIDKHAIKQTQLNFPDTIQLGNMRRWRKWSIDWSSLDIIFAGTPCQGFSSAGKGLNFNDPRSKLFFTFVDILNHARKYKPDIKFFLENVNMKKAWLGIISQRCNVFPVFINSALVSAQNRERWYWSNIQTKEVGLFSELHTDIPQPEDRGVFLKDILEEEVSKKYYVSKAVINRMMRKHYSIPQINPDKAGTLDIGNNSAKMSLNNGTTFVAMNVEGKSRTVRVGGSSTLSNKHNWDIIQLSPCTESNGRQPYQQNRVYDATGETKAPALMAELSCGSYAILQRPRGKNKGEVLHDKAPTVSSNSWEQNNLLLKNTILRRLTPTECARLQTIPEWYKWSCSDTQIYKMLGNGWTIEVIVWILSFWKWNSKKVAA